MTELTELTEFRTQNCLRHYNLKLTNLKLKTQLDRRTGFAGGGERGVLDRIGAKRRKTAAGSPKGDRTESINKMNRIALKEYVAKSGNIFRAG